MDNKFDIIFIGNGSITHLACFEILKKFPKLKIAIIGPLNFLNSASHAAGAMLASLGEIESNYYSSMKEKLFFNIGYKSRELWIDLLDSDLFKNCTYANDTIIYSRKNGSIFEKDNYLASLNESIKNKSYRKILDSEKKRAFNPSIVDNIDSFVIKDERGFNYPQIQNRIESFLSKYNVTFINGFVDEIDNNIVISNNIKFSSNKIIISCGSGFNNIKKSFDIFVPIFKGVGTALLINKLPDRLLDFKYVIRTPNRGGAQCGLHLVPYNNNLTYVGAGNYISNMDNPKNRLETIRYLTNIVENEILDRQSVYQSEVSLLQGYRPRSADGLPLIGNISDNHFIATGCNRVGLSWSPLIAKSIVNWLDDKLIDNLFVDFAPGRKLSSWGAIEEAKVYYSESRISNLYEHNLININDEFEVNLKKNEFEEYVAKKNQFLIEKYNADANFVFDPDLYSVL